MPEIVHSIEEYIKAIQRIQESWKKKGHILFRGQADAFWDIQSSLERSGISEISFKDYYTDIDYLKPEINSLSHHFERKITPKGYSFDFSDYNAISFNQFPELEYLTYLRHHGFPTPLIDFTQSEYIALFFACESLSKRNAKVFIVNDELESFGGTGAPEFHEIGHYIETDPRHIAQQSEYLVPAKFKSGQIGENPEWLFIPFSKSLSWQKDITSRAQKETGYDFEGIREIEIDATAKSSILEALARMNINHYTLYLNEDSLIKKLKYEFLRRKNGR